MSRLILIGFILSLLLGCQNNRVKSPSAPIANLPKMTYQEIEYLACIRKNGHNNKEFCACWSEAKNKVMPEHLKSRILLGDSGAIINSLSVMITHEKKLEYCDKLAKAKVIELDLTIPSFEVPELANRVLSQTKYNILTPDNRLLGKPAKSIGYEYHMNLVGYKPKNPHIQRLTMITDASYFFTNINSKRSRLNNSKYVHGVHYYLPLGDNSITDYQLSESSRCIFELDKPCLFSRSSKTEKYQMLTTFRGGMWISIEPATFSNSRYLKIRIFSADGLRLYEYRKSLKSNEIVEYLMHEPTTDWLNQK